MLWSSVQAPHPSVRPRPEGVAAGAAVPATFVVAVDVVAKVVAGAPQVVVGAMVQAMVVAKNVAGVPVPVHCSWHARVRVATVIPGMARTVAVPSLALEKTVNSVSAV